MATNDPTEEQLSRQFYIPIIDRDPRNYLVSTVNVNEALERDIIHYMRTEFIERTVIVQPSIVEVYDRNLLENRPSGSLKRTTFVQQGHTIALNNKPEHSAQQAHYRTVVDDPNIIFQGSDTQGYNVTRVGARYLTPVTPVAPPNPESRRPQSGPAGTSTFK